MKAYDINETNAYAYVNALRDKLRGYFMERDEQLPSSAFERRDENMRAWSSVLDILYGDIDVKQEV